MINDNANEEAATKTGSYTNNAGSKCHGDYNIILYYDTIKTLPLTDLMLTFITFVIFIIKM